MVEAARLEACAAEVHRTATKVCEMLEESGGRPLDEGQEEEMLLARAAFDRAWVSFFEALRN